MPVYDYRCTSCGNLVEVLHGINEHGPATCDVCGGAMRKALSPPAIVFKGSGWAKKDARTAPAAKAGDTKPREEREASGTGAASGESKESGSTASSAAAGTASASGADRPTASSSAKGTGE